MPDAELNGSGTASGTPAIAIDVEGLTKSFTPREGGIEHVGADNMAFGRDYIADWFAETLGGRVG